MHADLTMILLEIHDYGNMTIDMEVNMPKKQNTIQAGKFKAECLKIMDEVNRTKRSVIVTKRGTPVVQVVPISPDVTSLYGKMKGSFRIIGDIVKPIDEEWDANT